MDLTSNLNARGLVQIVFVFHDDIDLLQLVLPTSLSALTRRSTVSFETIIVADNTPQSVQSQLLSLSRELNIDEIRFRSRGQAVYSGAPSNNGHPRVLSLDTPYTIVMEDDAVVFRTDEEFDPLVEMIGLFARHPDLVAASAIRDFGEWTWPLVSLGSDIEDGVRSVNRLSAHFAMYDTRRIAWAAERFGAFDRDRYVDRDDFDYNWEDIVSHMGTTSMRRIAHVTGWPLDAYHCDRKADATSKYNTQDRRVKHAVAKNLLMAYDVVDQTTTVE